MDAPTPRTGHGAGFVSGEKGLAAGHYNYVGEEDTGPCIAIDYYYYGVVDGKGQTGDARTGTPR